MQCKYQIEDANSPRSFYRCQRPAGHSKDGENEGHKPHPVGVGSKPHKLKGKWHLPEDKA